MTSKHSTNSQFSKKRIASIIIADFFLIHILRITPIKCQIERKSQMNFLIWIFYMCYAVVTRKQKHTRKNESNRSLDFARRDGRSLVVLGEARSFHGDALENVADERVHNRHRFRRDASVRMHLKIKKG